jgi:hypothetical protein
MNTILKVSVAGALALGGMAAHASIAAPSSGSSDLILFAEVVNSSGTAVASYAGDTGLSVSNALSLTGTTKYLTGDSNLSALFSADGTGDSLVWALEGGAYTGTVTPKNFDGPGNAKFITTSTGDSTANLATTTVNNLENWVNIATTIGTLNTNLAGKTSVEGASPAAAGVWDLNTPSAVSGWFSSGPTTGNVVGATQQLFYVTGGGNGSTGTFGTDVVGTKDFAGAVLTSSGLSITAAGGAPVPLPAAVWLLGSGLLGLTGIARRKAKA